MPKIIHPDPPSGPPTLENLFEYLPAMEGHPIMEARMILRLLMGNYRSEHHRNEIAKKGFRQSRGWLDRRLQIYRRAQSRLNKMTGKELAEFVHGK